MSACSGRSVAGRVMVGPCQRPVRYVLTIRDITWWACGVHVGWVLGQKTSTNDVVTIVVRR